MRKILLIGANEKVHVINRLVTNLKKRNISFDFFKWGSLTFQGTALSAGENTLIDPENYFSAFLDVPSFDIVTTRDPDERIPFKIANEFDLITKKLARHDVHVLNGEFKLNNPYYNKFTQSFLFDDLQIPSIPSLHLVDNSLSKVSKMIQEYSFEFPLVIKQSQGGMGLNVWKINNEQELAGFLEGKRNWSLVYQPFIENDGDYRVLAVAGKSLGIMKRVAKLGEWRNNFSLGGSTEKHFDRAMESFVENICKKLGLEYCGADILKTKDGFMVIEINLFACFEGFEKTFPEIDVAEKIVNTLIESH